MILFILFLLIIIPTVEIAIFIWTGGYLGIWLVLLIILLTALLGTWLVRLEGFDLWRRLQYTMQQGKVPQEEILDGLCLLVGAILLLTPGFLTDLIGFLLVIPITRKPFKLYLRKLITKKLSKGTIVYRRW